MTTLLIRQTTMRRQALSYLAALMLVSSLSGCGLDGLSEAPDLPEEVSSSGSGTAFTVENGYIPSGGALSPFDIDHPAIANLDASLRNALLSAATDAKKAGVEMVVNSGWRSSQYQQALLDEAIANYGSELEARKWVNTPERSTHVIGLAVDIGYTDADSWLSQHGAAYGLCQTYSNEIWHFELSGNNDGECPAPIADASLG